jgi:hypothetical protein
MIAESCPKLLTIGGDSFNNFKKKMILPVGLFSLFQRRKRWVRIEYIWAFGLEVLKNQKNY